MEQDILIRIRAIDEASRTIRRVSESMKTISTPVQQMNKSMGKVQRTIVNITKPAAMGFNSMEEATSAAGLSMSKFNNYARMNFMEVQKGGMVMDKLTGKTISYGQAAKDASMQSRRFKFEWLSIMFAGMALDRAFGGLVRTQFELFGVSGLMADAWTVVLLPVMEKITPLLYDMIGAFMEMPEWMQEAVGGFVLFGAALGTILTVVGQLVLALMGFKLLKIGIDASTVTKQLGGLKSGLMGIKDKIGGVAKIAAAGIALKLAYDDLKSGKAIAALGDALFAAGIFMGKAGIYVMAVGVTLKILGDEELMIDLIKIMYKVGDFITSAMREAFIAGLTLREFRIENIEGFANIERAFKIAAEELSLEDIKIEPIIPVESIRKIREEQEKLTEQFEAGIITGQEYGKAFGDAQEAIQNLESQYILAVTKNEEWRQSVEEISDEWENVPTTVTTDYIINIRKTGLAGVLEGFFTGSKVAPTGLEGEPISPRREAPTTPAAPTITVTPTYNISSPDPSFVERLIKDREANLVNTIKRMVGL